MGGSIAMGETMTFADVLQKSFIAMSRGGLEQITTLNIIANISISFLVAMFIFYIYRTTYQGVLYQRSFNISLVMASVVTSMVIMTISGNLILSLGMVGALSIVRFRTPVKDSMDLVFLFWAIGVGIANGVSFYNISIVGSVMIALILIFLTRSVGDERVWVLVCRLSHDQNETELINYIKDRTSSMVVKSRIATTEQQEIIIELRIDSNSSELVNELMKQQLIEHGTLVSYEDGMTMA